MNKTLKKTLKGLKPPKVPDRVKLLSLLAIVLVVGAPALVSVIDNSYNQSVEYQADLSIISTDDSLITTTQHTKLAGVDLTVDQKATVIRESNTYNIVHSVDNSYGWIHIKDFTNDMIFDGVTKFVVTTSSPVIVDLRAYNDGVSSAFFRFVSDETKTVHTLELSSFDIIKIKSFGAGDKLVIIVGGSETDNPFTEDVLTVTIDSYGNATIPYAEIIIGATGAILILCALFATPYFGIFKKKGVKS